MRTSLLVVAAVALASVAVVSAETTRWHQLEPTGYDFDAYVDEFQKTYASPEEKAMRKIIFDKKLADIKRHNADTTKTWKQGVNAFTDMSPTEFGARLGYRKDIGYQLTGDGETPAEVEAAWAAKLAAMDPPAALNHCDNGACTAVKDQGQCGSCWTFATSETVESRLFMKEGILADLSEQQVASCSPNPQDCGGTGGCEGGTAEIGFAGIMKSSIGGLASEWTYPYTSYSGTDSKCALDSQTPVAKVTDYTKVAANSYSAVMAAVQDGPIAISVAAMSWSSYESGVFDGCNQTNPDIDHAVQLVGYGTDSSAGDYWVVRNSWSPSWGEKGFIRLKRQGADAKCGTDLSPGDGSGCHGGPPTVKVCGTCGVLYDTAFPIIG